MGTSNLNSKNAQLPSLHILAVIALLAASILGLLWSAGRFVSGAANIAAAFGISSLVIGLTLVSFGTSAPEILVSATSALKGVSELAVGNALGSNLANTGMVLAVTALVVAIPISRSIFRRELAVVIAVTAAAGLVLYDGYLGRWECLALVALVPVFLFIISRTGEAAETIAAVVEENDAENFNLPKSWLVLILGLVGMIGFSDLLVRSAVETASRAGVSELIIGATVVAVGTSLPELAASLTSALKGKTDIALGNVLGSNIFNLLLVLPIAGIIHPTVIEGAAFGRDFGVLMLMTTLLALICFVGIWRHKEKFQIGRRTGVALLFIYILYYYMLFG